MTFISFLLCTGAWPQYAGLQFFPHESGGGVPRNAQKIYRGLRGPHGEVVIDIGRKNGRNHFKRVGCTGAWPQCAGLQFFPQASGKWVKRIERTKNLQGAAPSRCLSCDRYCTKRRSKITFIRVVFLCTCTWPQYAGLQLFPHGSGGGIPRNAQKHYRGLRGPDDEVVFSSLYEKRSKITFIRVDFFCALAHGHGMPVCNFFLMGLGEGSQGTHKKFTGWLRRPDGDVVIDVVRKNGRQK